MARNGWTIGAMMAVLAMTSTAHAAASEELAASREAFAAGRLDQALTHARAAAEESADADPSTRATTLLNLGVVYHAMGEQKQASRVLEVAIPLADEGAAKSGALSVLARKALAANLMFSRSADRSEPLLREALALAEAGGEGFRHAHALVLHDMGLITAGRGSVEEAVALLSEAANAAERLGDESLHAKAGVNIVITYLQAGRVRDAEAALVQARDAIATLQSGLDRATLRLSQADAATRLAAAIPHQRNEFIREAHAGASDALRTAESTGNQRAETYALGTLGRLYEDDGRFDEAMQLTRRAAFVAQQGGMLDALYRWQWQTGRILAATGRMEDAIGQYRLAEQSLDRIRHDVAIGYGNRTLRSSFRDAVGDLYYQHADLLCRLADADPAHEQKHLLDALATIERLKDAELSDYFQDDCVNLVRSRSQRQVQSVDPAACVVYFVPLPDRTEAVLNLATGMRRVTLPVGAAELDAEVTRFRSLLESRTTHRYIGPSKQLYDWLIRPLESALASAGVETLVFVPDGVLGTVPMGALYDGEAFLVERYAVAVTPGLTLMDPRPIARRDMGLLMGGVSEGVQGFPPLRYVPEELDFLKATLGGIELVNRDFLLANLDRRVREQNYGIVHLASHGHFSADAKKSFVLTYDDKLTLDQLEALIRPSQFRGQPVEMLVLSACETAAGDSRAALGLAGVAVKAGARSAVASLWAVNDRASAMLVREFYSQLQSDESVTKAEALRRAQVKLLSDPRYRHAAYWSPYLVIGNWL